MSIPFLSLTTFIGGVTHQQNSTILLSVSLNNNDIINKNAMKLTPTKGHEI